MVALSNHYGLVVNKTAVIIKGWVMVIAIVISALLVAYLGISWYIAHSVMRVPRLPLGDTPASVGLAYEDVSFPSRTDKLTLKGWYIAGKKSFTIIIVTGMHQNRVDYSIGVLEMSRDLVARGYNVLLFDLRGRGESEGNGVLLTKFERDIGGAVDYIKQRGCPAEKIGFVGFSAGAASSIIFASNENVAALISDSCFADVADVFIGKGVSESGMPRWLIGLFGMGTLFVSMVVYGYRKVNPIDRVSAVAGPILFIQGGKDDLVPVNDARRLMEASGNPADELWIVPDAGHTLSYVTDPAGYMERVAAFFDRAKEAAARKQAARLF
jgi:alpha-beta hydrolase superfamily lysophospholipase